MLSIVVVSFNTRELLLVCLRRIFETSHELEVEVIVVENASEDGSGAAVKEEFPSVRLISNSQNLGFAAANNQGLNVAEGKFILLLNSDTETQPGALRGLIDFMSNHESVGLANPKLIYPSGKLQPAPSKIPSFWRGMVWDAFFWSTPLHRWFRRDYAMKAFKRGRDYDGSYEVEWVRGAAMMMRRSLVDLIGGLDEKFFFGYEEIDYSVRSLEAGFKNAYHGSSVIVHQGSQSHAPFGRGLRELILRGAVYFWRKHGSVWHYLTVRALIAVIAVGSMVRRLPLLLFKGSDEITMKYRADISLLQFALRGSGR